MRPLQYWLEPRVPSHAWRHRRLRIRVDQACVKALIPWKDSQWMERGLQQEDGHDRCFQHGFLKWAQLNLRLLRATHMVQRIWEVFGKAEVDLFTSEDSSHWPIYYLKDRDVLAHSWPNLLLYTFSLTVLDPSSNQVSQGTEAQASSVGPSLEKPTSVLGAVPAARSSPPWPIPLRRDLLSQLELRLQDASMLLNGLSFPPGVQPAAKTQPPVTYRLKVYVTAITAPNALIAHQSAGRNNLVVPFLKESTIPTWDLSTSVKHMGDLQALSVNSSCLEFRPGDSKEEPGVEFTLPGQGTEDLP
ncbi:Maestro heat-like repeat-containing protein family member 1 [Labeo rohita]|uniref:Maestro heat-like repeat-containing protein family member 1 n=1 Tax=Labeo rohita TaxID=84645 RepID=A0ABQ8L205_LABRO|nr:Maestro heat-like repeat-containing protein family member 1 [Labeo rohita]